MSETLEHLQKRARELARSGNFSSWRSVAFELQFEPNLREVFKWLHDAAVEDVFEWLHSAKRRTDSSEELLQIEHLQRITPILYAYYGCTPNTKVKGALVSSARTMDGFATPS